MTFKVPQYRDCTDCRPGKRGEMVKDTARGIRYMDWCPTCDGHGKILSGYWEPEITGDARADMYAAAGKAVGMLSAMLDDPRVHFGDPDQHEDARRVVATFDAAVAKIDEVST